jgi:hypothetical protein
MCQYAGRHRWYYKTIEWLAVWGPWSDLWRTGLWEYHQGKRYFYNYVFLKDVGLVNFWQQLPGGNPLDSDFDGWGYYAVSWRGM